MESDWDRLEYLAQALSEDRAALPIHRNIAATTLAAARLLRGRGISSGELLARELENASHTGPGLVDPLLQSVWVAWYTEGQLAPLAGQAGGDTGAKSIVAHAVRAASLGDTVIARQELARLTVGLESELGLYGEVPIFIQAVIAAHGLRWQEVVHLLGPGAARGYDVGKLVIRTPRVPRQWLVAEAYHRLRRADSAAAFFERVADLKGGYLELLARSAVYPFVHRRLAQAYTELGQEVIAAEHWNLFLEVFTDPDPELQFMVAEAREALAALADER